MIRKQRWILYLWRRHDLHMGSFQMTSMPPPSRAAHVTRERRLEAQAERPMGGVHVVVAEPEWRLASVRSSLFLCAF